ncbi:hypothetical protein [Asticcacaulis endophyticus]|uniref:Uncharacterized protein n=1 Tax=Asticcacaulis endophyticus TaxID=1395890 RepID=A0A918QD69_9CAUL|nr:hypothetical protein [Asticcacaulis endophyticus]GGZ41665.1 hypothetical protein GCM10011273_30400 [Asticcacaulis endophyticus]
MPKVYIKKGGHGGARSGPNRFDEISIEERKKIAYRFELIIQERINHLVNENRRQFLRSYLLQKSDGDFFLWRVIESQMKVLNSSENSTETTRNFETAKDIVSNPHHYKSHFTDPKIPDQIFRYLQIALVPEWQPPELEILLKGKRTGIYDAIAEVIVSERRLDKSLPLEMRKRFLSKRFVMDCWRQYRL